MIEVICAAVVVLVILKMTSWSC